MESTSGKSLASADAVLPTSPAVTTNSEMSGIISYLTGGPEDEQSPATAQVLGVERGPVDTV